MRELKSPSRDLTVTEQLNAALHLFACGIGLSLVIAGQVLVDAFLPAVSDRIPESPRPPIKVEPARHS